MSSGKPEVSDEHFRLLVDAVKDYAIFILDPHGVIRSWNAGAERIKGYTPDEIIGRHFSVFYSDADRADGKPERALAEALRDGRLEDLGWRIRKDGSQFWASVVLTALHDRAGTHIGFAKVTRDLTDSTYRTYVETMNAIVWTTDAGGRPNGDSPTWRAFTGQTEAEWRGRKAWEPVHPEDQPALRAAWERAKADHSNFEAELRLRRHDGAYVWMGIRAIPLRNDSGAVREWFGVTFDISARKDADLERERAQSWWTTTLRSIGDGVVATEPDGRVRFMNPVAERLTGWTLAEAQGRPLAEVFPIFNEDTREPVENPVDKVLREGKIVGLANHTVLVRRDGVATPIDDSAAPIVSAAGELDGVVLVFRDATSEKREALRRDFLARAGDQLLASTDYRAALTKIAQLAVPRLADWCSVDVADGTGRIERLATAHVDPAKVAYAEELARRFPPDRDAPTGVPNVIRTGRSELYETVRPELIEALPDPELRRIMRELDLRSAMIVPLPGRERVFGAITFVYAQEARHYTQDDVAFAEELARRAALIVERRRLEEEAADANRTKDEFLATVSHELRTPLQAILGWATLLERGTARDPAKALAAILRNATAQARLIEDILDVSRIISGKLALAIRRTDLAAVIRAAADALRPEASAHRLNLVERLAPDLGELDGDPDRLQQVVWNLVSNAVKFTPDGGTVTISAERIATGVRITVQDTGRGIAREHLSSIFERFRQVDSSTTRERGGLGLGLAIARHLVLAHGGTITAESAGPGHGATFTVTLPAVIKAPATSGAVEGAPRSLAGVSVLLVDDEPDARELLGEVLAEAGARVRTTGSAAKAYELFLSEPPDVLVSDIGMPHEDGYSLMRRIRALAPDRGGTVPAIALTAYARPEDKRRCEEAGFQLHVVKPVRPALLVQALHVLSQARALHGQPA